MIVLFENSQMITFQAATGQPDFAAFTLKTQDIPLLKLGEAKGVNRIHIWRRPHISEACRRRGSGAGTTAGRWRTPLDLVPRRGLTAPAVDALPPQMLV